MSFVSWLGFRLSVPRIFSTDETWRTTLFVNVTCCTTLHDAVPPWLRGVNRTEYPGYAACQLYSMTLPSTSTRCAFFSSNRFLTCQLCVFHASCLARWLPVNVMSDGTRFGI